MCGGLGCTSLQRDHPDVHDRKDHRRRFHQMTLDMVWKAAHYRAIRAFHRMGNHRHPNRPPLTRLTGLTAFNIEEAGTLWWLERIVKVAASRACTWVSTMFVAIFPGIPLSSSCNWTISGFNAGLPRISGMDSLTSSIQGSAPGLRLGIFTESVTAVPFLSR